MTVEAISRWPDPQRGVGLAARGLILRTVSGLHETYEQGEATFRKNGKPVFSLACEEAKVHLRILGAREFSDPYHLSRYQRDRGHFIPLHDGSDIRSPGLIWVVSATGLL